MQNRVKKIQTSFQGGQFAIFFKTLPFKRDCAGARSGRCNPIHPYRKQCYLLIYPSYKYADSIVLQEVLQMSFPDVWQIAKKWDKFTDSQL